MQLYGPFAPNKAECSSFSWVMTEQHISRFYFLIYYSEPFCLGKVEITNEMVLADRNVIRVAGGEEGEAACLNNCQNESRGRKEGIKRGVK